MSQEACGIQPSELIKIGKDSLTFKAMDVFDLRSAFTDIFNVSGAPDDEENKGEGEGGDGDDDGGDGNEDDAGEDSGDGTKIKDPEKKKLSDEAAKYRVRAKELADELAEKTKRLKEVDDKDKSELEKAQRDAKEALERAEKAEARALEREVKLAFYDSGAASLFRNPATALKLLDLGDLKPDDEGVVDNKEVRKRADELLKAEPYLGKGDSDEDDDEPVKQASGRPTNGKSGKKDQLNKEVLAAKFPALRSR